MALRIILHSTYIVPFYGGIIYIGILFLVLGHRKNTLLIYCVPLVKTGRRRLSINVKPNHSSCTPPHNLDVIHSNLVNGLSIFLSPWWDCYDNIPGILVPSTWWHQLLCHSKVIYHYSMEKFLISLV